MITSPGQAQHRRGNETKSSQRPSSTAVCRLALNALNACSNSPIDSQGKGGYTGFRFGVMNTLTKISSSACFASCFVSLRQHRVTSSLPTRSYGAGTIAQARMQPIIRAPLFLISFGLIISCLFLPATHRAITGGDWLDYRFRFIFLVWRTYSRTLAG